jgi:hypothetical protein
MVAESNGGEPDEMLFAPEKQKPHELKELWGGRKRAALGGSVK